MRRKDALLSVLSSAFLVAGAASAMALMAAQAATTSPNTIFGSATPAKVDSGDSNAVELGVKFPASETGSITGIRFYKASTNTGTHVGSLWTSAGSLLAQATFSNETASGWQSVNFSSPVAISAGTTYVAGYYAPAGHYSDDQNGLSSSVANGPLTAIGNSTSADGVYAYGSSPSFPSSAWNASNYYVDVNFVPGSGSSRPRPPASSRDVQQHWSPDAELLRVADAVWLSGSGCTCREYRACRSGAVVLEHDAGKRQRHDLLEWADDSE